MDYQQIRAILTEHFKTILEQRKTKINAEGSLSLDQIVCEQIRIDRITQEIEVDRAVNYNQGWNIGTDEEIEKLIEKLSLGIAKGSPLFEKVRVEYLKATRSTAEKILDYSKGFDSYDLGTEAPAPHPTTLEAINTTARLMDVYDLYEQEKLRLNRWTPKTAKNSRSQVHLLQEFLGKDTPMEISRKRTADVKAMLLAIPMQARVKPKYKSLSITELTKLQHNEFMSEKNINKYLETYSGLYYWATRRGDISDNYFRDFVNPLKPQEAPRLDFSIEQVNIITHELLSNQKTYQDHHKWGTLVGLYTGARLNEVGQLEIGDIIQENDIYCFHFTDVATDPSIRKSLKNRHSIRTVPIHPHLIEHGFLKYIAKIKAGKHSRVFPQLSYDSNNGYGRNLGRWFSESFLKKMDLKTDKLSFHSFRHTVAACLIKADVQEPIVTSITGHASKGVLQRVYAKGYTIAQKAEALSKLPY